MRKPMPLTGSSTVIVTDLDRDRFLSSLQAAISRTLSSGKITVLPRSTRPEAPTQKAPEPRSAPPSRPTFKRHSALTR